MIAAHKFVCAIAFRILTSIQLALSAPHLERTPLQQIQPPARTHQKCTTSRLPGPQSWCAQRI